jgi:hypothetical protein
LFSFVLSLSLCSFILPCPLVFFSRHMRSVTDTRWTKFLPLSAECEYRADNGL